ncbi:SAM-dependent methyltransferase [Campylobacter helveticus]|uniref:site-specific DNA-methyltransferase (adenine-specific) n=1 Tax=Campylobacter helveticus TaxID=28898 RepID=A0ABY3L058_9BACT|nr:N-6 DNA methylase [Campylobacter helveticus]MCR2039494.1 SAM-dependent methyltransferase [Campylobacter helveticus]TXK56241.1 N-6 DNA methylase [Campylobacter helveticus]
MANEKHTENLILNAFEAKLGKNEDFSLFMQSVDKEIPALIKAFKEAGGKPDLCDIEDFSKGGNGIAQPDFIALFDRDKDTIFICECKKGANFHRSANLNKPKSYALDGVIYYAKFLQKYFNVIALAVSGTKELKSTALYFPKSANLSYDEKVFLKTENIILNPLNYLKLLKGERLSREFSLSKVSLLALEFHDTLREIKISERHKPIFIAGLLLALENDDFRRDYYAFNSFNTLYSSLRLALNEVLNKADLTNKKIKNIENAINEVENNVKLKEKHLIEKGSIFWYLKELDMKIRPMINHANSNLDALGIFYHEFIKYTGGDGKGLGIVLTPAHLSEFMCEIAGVNKKSKVLDICCGSASFLVSAMVLMIKQANEKEASQIKKEQIYGIELDPDLYTLANTNMIMRRDGKSNIYQGDCFNEEFDKLKGVCNVGILNPPYSQKDKSELEFVERLCELIVPGGLVCVVVPLSCAIGNKFKLERERLFKKHSLLAVFSMPDDIFYSNNANTNTCVTLWQAHTPHYINVNLREKELLVGENIRNFTYFGFYKDDGFVKAKKLGRIDKYNRWQKIKKEWIENYQLKKQIDGLSIVKKVTHLDEWLAEAYIKTDYSKLTREDFEKTLRYYYGFLIRHNLLSNSNAKFQKTLPCLKLDNLAWCEFKMVDIFEKIIRGKRLKSEDREHDLNEKQTLYFSASELDNGLTDKITNPVFVEKNALIYTTFGDCFYVEGEFSASDEINIFKHSKMDKYSALFIATIISQNKYRYRFGRKAFFNKFENELIKLPALKEKGEMKPDFAFMSSYIKTLKYSEFI